MLIDILIVSTIYMGVSLYKKSTSQKKKRVIKKQSSDITTDMKLQINTAQDKAKYYTKTSAIGMGMMLVHQFNPIFHILSLGLLSYNSIPIFNSAKQSWFKEKKLTNNFLNSIVIMLCIVTKQFFVASLIGLSYHLGIFLLEKAQGHSKKMLVDVYSWQPQFVWVLKESVEIEIPLAEIKAGDILIVHTGEAIPVDGTIVQGSAIIDEQALTGESQPIEKIVGNQVFASTLLMSGSLQIAVKKTGRETTIAEIGKILNHSAEYKAQTQLNGEIWADKAVVPQIGLAVISWPAFGINGMGGILKQSFGNIIRILVSLDTINHLTIASRNSILIKHGQALENLGNIDTVLFDKTGTLTTGQLQVTKIIAYNHYDKSSILRYAAIAEYKLNHPIAKAILQKAADENLELPKIADNYYHIGYGIQVNIDQDSIYIGSLRFMQNKKFVIPAALEQDHITSHSDGCSLVVVAFNNDVIGAIELKASLRPETMELISALKQRGINHIAVVSGDHQQPTQQLAKTLGLDDYFYDVLPHDKKKIVEALQSKGRKVCFVGDGINDTIAMQQADVSISLSGATSIAIDTAQVIFTDGNLSHIPTLLDIANSLDKKMHQTLWITGAATTVNVGCIYLFGFGILGAVVLNHIGFFIGLGNTMLPLYKIKK